MGDMFANAGSFDEDGYETAGKRFGERYNGRYHMPLLPGERGTKAGGGYVPGGVMSATNLAGAFVDSRELSLWEQQRMILGLARREELYEKAKITVDLADLANVNTEKLSATPEGKALRDDLNGILAMARAAGGGELGAGKGTNRHAAWEARAVTGALVGTKAIRASVEDVERLLHQHHLERVPALQERVVRNLAVSSAGRFDDVLLSRKTGRLYMADLKTKPKSFYSWCETWIQQWVYAAAEWMLDDDRTGYIPGPAHHVDQQASILLRMPSDGAPAYLQRVDLTIARRWAMIALSIVEARSEGKSRKLDSLTAWSE